MKTDDLDFLLPPELIAQTPPEQRTASRLLHYRRADHSVAHHTFSDLPHLLRPGDLLVFNDARVVPARFTLRKATGGLVEGLYLGERAPGEWRVLLKNLGPPNAEPLAFENTAGVRATVLEREEGGEVIISVEPQQPALQLLAEIGRMPLPPYIRREKGRDVRDAADRDRYQTVYARQAGAVAAPTAGLHFTPELLEALSARSVEQTFVTLHVGLGTFQPVKVQELSEHPMHREAYTIDATAADALNRAKREGRRIIAVGTTSARVLETHPADQPFHATSAETQIFIYPPYEWRHVGAMVTNFHLPRSTLIALVAAMVGLQEQKKIYATAIGERYRFFSYGDAMFIE